MAWIVALSAATGLMGYLSGGTNAAAKYGAVAFVVLFSLAWTWGAMESYT